VTAAEATSSAYVAASGSLSTRVTATEATASAYVAASGSLAARITSNEAKTGSYATTGSNSFNGSQTVTGSLTATGTITAQTLVVQTITSSVEFVTGSNRFGTTTGNTHEFTGSLLVSGSGYVNGSVGIGTTPSYTLDVRGDVNGDVVLARLQNRDGNLSTGAYIGFSTGYAAMATIGAKREGAENDSSLVFSPMLNENAVERMRITSGGNIGIGTTNPSTVLHISTTTPTIRMTNTSAGSGAGSIQFYSGSTQIWNLGTHTNNDMYLYNNIVGSYNYWIQNSTGNVGIGTTNPGSKLQVGDAGTAPNGIATLTLTGANTTPQIATKPGLYHRHAVGLGVFSDYVMSFQVNGSTTLTDAMYITNDAKVGIGITTPYSRLDINGGNIRIGEILNNASSYIGKQYSANSNFYSSVQFLSTTGQDMIVFNTHESGQSSGERMRITGDGVLQFSTIGTVPTYNNSIYSYSSNGYMYIQGGTTGLGLTGSGNRNNAIYINSTNNAIYFQTNGAGTRMQIMSGGAVGTGQSANGTSLRATLVKQGTTSITFTATLNTIGAWRPGHAMIRVSGAQNGLQEYWAAWFFVRLIGYVGNGVATSVLDSGGETGNVSFSSSTDTNSPQTLNFILTDSGASTNTMIADIDFVYNEGIVSLT
jgi:hypothetical protein